MPASKHMVPWRVVLLVILNIEAGLCSKSEGDLRYHAELDTKGKLRLFWDIDPPTETVTFRLEAKVNKKSVIGFGFSDYGETTNADMVMMWTDDAGKHHFQVNSLHIV